jgi:hypothetical protein
VKAERPEPYECDAPITGSLKGSNIQASVPNKSLVVLNLVFIQKATKLALKIMFGMMLLLVGDVFDHGRHLQLADGKCAISFLPIKSRKSPCFFIQRDESRLISPINLLKSIDLPSETSKWMWFNVPFARINFDLLFSTIP